MKDFDIRLFDFIPQAFPGIAWERREHEWWAPVHFDLTPSRHGIHIRESHPYVATCWSDDQHQHQQVLAWYQELNNCDYSTAMSSLAPMLGIEWHERPEMTAMRKLRTSIQQRLHSDDGVDVLHYLTAIRHYNADFIDYAELGAMSVDDISTLLEALPSQADKLRDISSSITTSHRLVIPLVDSYGCYGFAFRDITGKASAKYLRVAWRAGFPGLRGKSDRWTLVEGELDALKASYADAGNYIALQTNDISDEQVQSLLRYGIKHLTVLLDTDDTDGEPRQISRRISIANKLASAGITTYISALPSTDGKKMDADAYLRDHTGEELAIIIEQAVIAPIYEATAITADYMRGSHSDQTLLQYIQDIKDIACRPAMPMEMLPRLNDLYKTATAGQDDLGDLDLTDISALRDERVKRAHDEHLRQGLQRAANIAKQDLGKAMQYLQTLQTSVTDDDNPLEHHITREEIEQGWHTLRPGLPTPYMLTSSADDTYKERWEIPAGALTFIAAMTSHGKTRLLENLALHMAQSPAIDGRVIYMSYEESAPSIRVHFINIHHGRELAYNNLRSLRHYMQTGDVGFFRDQRLPDGLAQSIEDITRLELNQRLQIIGIDMSAEKLCANICQGHARSKIAAVFVDYVQLLHSTTPDNQRYLELDDICKLLRKTANSTGLPIILGAQLNRQVNSPYDMDLSNIAQGSIIEQCANQVILLWNSARKALASPGKSFDYDQANKLPSDAQRLLRRGFQPGLPGHIYINLAKNRGGERGLDAVLQFNGNTGVISPE